ncbi:hypothetical protein AMIS_32190 [Actinoplanes missouriensis 431]|uniref:Xylose isomerase-like TIM barrel domain-containing protein n=1 Tax=Actinoplanes missouriensis (strain ATCC 14538 / DSM 43046 / CBS 188.64 / JCM 3121 / NBRC 102363 / NCIMB 12654 / NRRL B-3342 / UNCC 431) TaxID=512565 RepID=I0H602_ACTM4|nr:sugar phosphate isomerase/epimerase family protein [Actinoplanes missouriensis]BAL88439.1 hypothetical protein AMIS_32190 [Actinoplanes missouriensis 431]
MRLGLCLAAFGGEGLGSALKQLPDDTLALDVPTDTTLGLIDVRRCADDRAYLDEIAAALSGHTVGVVSNSRDAQLLLGPHGPHTAAVCPGDPGTRMAHALRCGLGTIRLAERLGAPAVRLLPGCPDFGRWLSWWGSDAGWADNIAVFRDRAAPLITAAREAGVLMMLEPHPKQIVYDRASAELLFAMCGDWDDVLRLCVDPANLAAIGHDAIGAVRGWNGRMAAVHAKDLQRHSAPAPPAGAGWSRYGPQPPIRFRALGLGELDWPAIVAALQDECFEGVLYLEHEDTLLPREQSIRRSLDLLRAIVPQHAAQGRTW